MAVLCVYMKVLESNKDLSCMKSRTVNEKLIMPMKLSVIKKNVCKGGCNFLFGLFSDK